MSLTPRPTRKNANSVALREQARLGLRRPAYERVLHVPCTLGLRDLPKTWHAVVEFVAGLSDFEGGKTCPMFSCWDATGTGDAP